MLAFKDDSFTEAGQKGDSKLNTVHISTGSDQQLQVPRTHKEFKCNKAFWKES